MTQTQLPPSEPTQGARRYPRTFGGLVGSMVVVVIGVVIYWALQNGTHTRPDIQPEAVDYLSTVEHVQGSDYQIAYPPALDKGWMSVAVRFTPGDRPAWGLSILTDEEKFVGVQQEDDSLSALLTTYVDKGAKQGKDVTLSSAIASQPTTWTTWSDHGGDHALATEINGDTLLVYGSASMADLTAVATSLTLAPVAR